MRLSVIIPTLNEATELERAVGLLQSRNANGLEEIIVADCGSQDETVTIATQVSLRVTTGADLNSRARACNAGAALARGDTFLFLHADSQVPVRFDHQIAQALHHNGVVGGAFRFKLNGPELRLRLVEFVNHVRYRVRSGFFGDQGIFVRRSVFESLGGFPDVPIMEDSLFCHKLCIIGEMQLLSSEMLTSPRRFYNGGILRTLAFDSLIWAWTSMRLDPGLFAERYRQDNHRRGFLCKRG